MGTQARRAHGNGHRYRLGLRRHRGDCLRQNGGDGHAFHVHAKAHDEDDEKDIELVWERIQKLGTGTISLTDMYSADVNENITTFVSILHLVRNGKVAIWQDELPRGEIFIEMKLDWMTGTVEDVDAVEAVQKQEAVM